MYVMDCHGYWYRLNSSNICDSYSHKFMFLSEISQHFDGFIQKGDF